MSAEEILGKSGKVKIKVSYTNHSKVNKKIDGEKQQLYTPFLMATGVILPTETFSDVEVDHGKVVNEGSNNIVIGFGLPGMADSLGADGDVAEKLPEAFEIRLRMRAPAFYRIWKSRMTIHWKSWRILWKSLWTPLKSW